MRPRFPSLLFVAVAACSRPSSSGPVEDDPGNAYARASAALDASHPRTLPDLARVVGTPPARCDLSDATCVCAWRFATGKGVKEIGVAASFADARSFEPETVLMIAPDGNPLDLAPDEAERGYGAGEYRAPPGGSVPMSTSGGRIEMVRSEELTKALNEGGHLVSRRALKGAELEKDYGSWTEARRLDACLGQPAPVRLVKRDGNAATW
jgi:hypothetical protein